MTAANPFLSPSITLGRELADAAEGLRRCTVEVREADAGRGSGVIWRSDGLVVTNAHVASSSRHSVRLSDGRVFPAELIRRDPRCDLAALRIEASGLPAARSRDASSLRTGELVLAVGNPLEATGAFAVGIVSAAPKRGDAFVRADIRLAPGNSGGPLADADGNVVGINRMIVGGFGVAVTSTTVRHFLAASHWRIGVTVRPVSVYVTNRPVLGLMVVALEAGGPAHLSGVLVGDVVVRANHEWLNSTEQLSNAIYETAQTLSLDLLREGRLRALEVILVREKAAEVA